MYDIAQDVAVYDVRVNHGTLALVDLDKGRTGCSVQLDGAIVPRWAERFQRERRESRALSRFELNPTTRIVSFVRESGGDPADVMEALGNLEAFVERVNRETSQAAR